MPTPPRMTDALASHLATLEGMTAGPSRPDMDGLPVAARMMLAAPMMGTFLDRIREAIGAATSSLATLAIGHDSMAGQLAALRAEVRELRAELDRQRDAVIIFGDCLSGHVGDPAAHAELTPPDMARVLRAAAA